MKWRLEKSVIDQKFLAVALGVALFSSAAVVQAELTTDCNGNGIPDVCEVDPDLHWDFCQAYPSAGWANDCNAETKGPG